MCGGKGGGGSRLYGGNGSIPACAGESQPIILQVCQGTVYPRMCGGKAGHGGAAGLPYRLRGVPVSTTDDVQGLRTRRSTFTRSVLFR